MQTLRTLIAGQRLKVIFALLAGASLLVLWISVVDMGQVKARLEMLDVRWLAAFTVLWLAAAFLRSLRWRVILSKIESVPPLETFAAFMACMFVNFVIPLRIGEVVGSLALKRNRGIPIAKSLPTQIMDRLLDLTPIVPALVLAFFMRGEGVGSLRIILGFVAAVFALLTAIVLVSMAHPAAAAACVRRLTGLLPRAIRARVEHFGLLCMEGLGDLKLGAAVMAGLIGITFLALALDSLALGMIFRGLGYEISPAVVLTGYTLLFLTSALPRPPGQVGSLEVLFLLIFSLLLGVDRNVASAAVVVGHSMIALILAVTGSLSLFALGIRSASVVREHMPSVTTTGAS